MGVFTDNIQALNRGFLSERAEKKAIKEEKLKYKNYLYKKFYSKFKENQEKSPDLIYSYFIQTEIQEKILNNFQNLDFSTKIELYNAILNKLYKQFKNDYLMNYDFIKIEKEEEKEKEKLLKILKQKQRKLEKAKKRYYKSIKKYNKSKNELQKTISKGFKQIVLGLFLGGRIANKTYRKMKY